jgi:hypothetical protein
LNTIYSAEAGKLDSLPIDNADEVAIFVDAFDQTGTKMRGCGVGVTNNKGDKPKGVVCTDLKLVSSAKCLKFGTAAEMHTVPDGIACLQWSDRDNNL